MRKNLWNFVVLVLTLCGACTYFLLLAVDTFQQKCNEAMWISPDITQGDVMDNPMVEYVRKHHLFPPASPITPYNLSVGRTSYLEHVQYYNHLIYTLNKHRIRCGFFIEAGALDGQILSHTLLLEKDYGWNGLLVEASPSKIPLLKGKNRKAWIADVCLAERDNMTVEFVTRTVQDELWMMGNGRINPMDKNTNASQADYKPELHSSEGQVKCFRLPTLLKGIGVSEVDLIVLDIQGHEFQVLKTIPFDEIHIKVIALEYEYIPEGFLTVWKFMKGRGYRLEYVSGVDMILVSDKL